MYRAKDFKDAVDVRGGGGVVWQGGGQFVRPSLLLGDTKSRVAASEDVAFVAGARSGPGRRWQLGSRALERRPSDCELSHPSCARALKSPQEFNARCDTTHPLGS